MTRPVFVVGMNGSGTTMLLDSLGRHPGLYAFPRETRVIPFLIGRASALADLDDDELFLELWQLVLGQGVFRMVNGGAPVTLPDDWRECPRNVGAVLDWLFRYFAAREGKSRWCEKSPQYVQHIASLGALYPEAKFIHVIRDGRDSAASFQRRWKRTPDLTIYRWKKVIREGRRQASTLAEGRYLEVHYEQLTTDTEHWLRAICGFLDEPFDTAILESSQPYLAGRDDDEDGDDEPKSKTLVPNSGKWREQFSSAEIQSLESIAGSALQECGYETAQADGDRDLTRGERRMLSLRDNAVQFGREVQMKLRGQIERPWRVILSRPLVSLRQNRHNQY